MPPLIMFDLDMTLAVSKAPLTPQMADLVTRLLQKTKVAVISGGALPQFLKQVVGQLAPDVNLKDLYLLPTSGAALYEWHSGTWQKVYEKILTLEEAERIKKALIEGIGETGIIDLNSPSYGERIEYRGTQVSMSALGQLAPVEAKLKWDPDKSKRRALQEILQKRLPEFKVAMGGATTIDITQKGIDKGYGIKKLAEHLGLPVSEMLYVGDQLVPGGNDEPALHTGIKTRAVADPSETAFFISSLLS
jgi:phosphomannomutase